MMDWTRAPSSKRGERGQPYDIVLALALGQVSRVMSSLICIARKRLLPRLFLCFVWICLVLQTQKIAVSPTACGRNAAPNFEGALLNSPIVDPKEATCVWVYSLTTYQNMFNMGLSRPKLHRMLHSLESCHSPGKGENHWSY